MPSDPRVTRALELLARPVSQYRAAVAATLEEVRGHLAAGRSDAEARARRLRDQFGAFADGRIDTSRLATVLGDRDALDASALQRLERASDTLRNIVSRGADLFSMEVPAGGDLAGAVGTRFAVIGRAFAAARIAAAARNGAASGLEEGHALEAFPFGEWSGAERKLAPSLIVTVNGADVVAGALAPFLDGGLKLLLIVNAPCPPAVLARLVTPGVLVMQVHDAKELELMAEWPATAIGALVPAGAIRFVHDPSRGPEAWQRLSMQPAGDLRLARVGGFTTLQQGEDVRLLELLAKRPPAPAAVPAAPAPAAESDPVDRLAAWLLQQAQMTSGD